MSARPEPEAIKEATIAALQQAAQGQWAAAVESLKLIVDADDDPTAVAVLAYALGQSGQAAQGIQYAKRAISEGIGAGVLGANYAAWTLNDPTLREHTAQFFRDAIAAGWTMDPFSQAQQLIQMGEPERGYELLHDSKWRTPIQAEQAWETLLAEVVTGRQSLDADLRAVNDARAQALSEIRENAEEITSERDRVRGLVGETTRLVQDVAADNLASEYADRAKGASRRAGRWTLATLVVSVTAIAIAALFVLIGLAEHHDVSTVLSRAAISLPLLAMATYLNHLGGEERRDARNWTHIELQIRTARPYLGNLDDTLRAEVQAALALRFFPGQSQDPHGAATNDDPEEALRFVRELRSRNQLIE
jgi:hypothetical protein